uniref:SWIM-type domain-containing protein n=1 Tax=Tanacetum cinerariifolium TaxID=118510 RepID=A0A6L2P3U0_TANCI|nr:hypothetical protein [Tanacetum cinerariifolium]
MTDRHSAIIRECNMIFSNAFHGYCYRHLMMNCKLKSDKLQCVFWKTCKAYTPEEFQRRTSDLRGLRPKAYQKLEDAGFETWSRAICPANRYNYMTSNNVESINNLSRHVRKTPMTMLIEWYKALLEKWYYSSVHTLSDWATHIVMDRMQKSVNWKVYRIHQGKVYQVNDRRKVHRVYLTTCSCTCRKWQLSGIPCSHVITVGRVMGCTDCSDMTLAYTNMIGRSQEYEPAYTNSHRRSQEYKPVYNNMIRMSQEYSPSYNNNNRRSQEHEAANNNIKCTGMA